MYWPIGTPRIYATTTSSNPNNLNPVVSHDGLFGRDPRSPSANVPDDAASLSTLETAVDGDREGGREPTTPALESGTHTSPRDAAAPATPGLPTPITPGIGSIEHRDLGPSSPGSDPYHIPTGEPIVALKTSRTGHLFAAVTASTLTIWQTKPTVVLAIVVRSEASRNSYGSSIDLLIRPDSAIFVVQTSLDYLITYSLATDAESRVFKPHFVDHTNIQRRRQSHFGGPGNSAPDQILLGPGEGAGVRDVSVRFRRVIKVDAGIQCALALDDELVVATKKPAAIQCIRWAPDSTDSHMKAELVSRMGWLEKKATIHEMTHDRPMNLSTWVTNDGKAYAVQRIPPSHDRSEADSKKLFKGYCFHTPESPSDHAIRAVVNARFSLIAVGCVDGSIRVYSARDYAGNIPSSHIHQAPVSSSRSGRLTTLSYSPDGYCLFAGYENGWAAWSVFGKTACSSFNADPAIVSTNREDWLAGVGGACWVGGACELLLIGRENEAIWSLEMARSAVTGCYSPPNLFRTVLQSSTSIMIYRGYDLPDLTSISAEPFLWHMARIPSNYLLNQWPIKCTVVSSDGRYVAVAGRRGLAHYSVNSGRWKTFTSQASENEFQVRGGMCWYQHILVAAIEANRCWEIRLYSREADLDGSKPMFAQQMPAPIVLITPSGEDSLLVYTYENILYHFVFAPVSGIIQPIQVGQIAFNGIVRSPARVRGLSWILPEKQMLDGDPSQDVAYASVLFLVDGKLVLLQPSVNQGGQLKYDMRVISHCVEFYASMRDQSPLHVLDDDSTHLSWDAERGSLRNSLWIFEGHALKLWPDVHDVLHAASNDSHKELPPTVSIPLDFYPLSILLGKGIVLGVEPDLVQRRDNSYSFFRFSIRTHLFLPDVLQYYLRANDATAALTLARQYQDLEYFAHGLEILLHHVLDEEVDLAPPPEAAVLPRVLTLLSSFKQYLDIVVQCTRKTEVRSWRTLFAYLPPPQELFEESLQRGSLKTAGGYLLILHTFEELDTASEQSVRLLSRAIKEEEWELCKELARFLAAMDESGGTLREAMAMVNLQVRRDVASPDMMSKLEVPSFRTNGHSRLRRQNSDTSSDGGSTRTVSSFGGASSPT
ncbi:RIC1-domain-containing protein [Xylariaceae sp. FL0594]|nr:RIC1-domain-containing protein [Xylariaceae sp. FL0594]